MLRLRAQLPLMSLVGAYASLCLHPALQLGFNWSAPKSSPSRELLDAPWLAGIGPVTQTPEAPHWASAASFLSRGLGAGL